MQIESHSSEQLPKALPLSELSLTERLNFLLTNRLPRRWATLLMGRVSRIRNPLFTRVCVFIWQLFVDDLRLHEAEKQKFDSLHDCFTRRLKPGSRHVEFDPLYAVSPCDAVIGAHGRIHDGHLFQAKGFPYTLNELLHDAALADRYRSGQFVTLRLKSSMYHRFHAPLDCRTETVNYLSGDTWNVNPVALKCIEKLFCKNERAVIELKPDDPEVGILLVPVAAILVASIRLRGLDYPLNLQYAGPNRISWQARFNKGDEMGYFEHGSTIVALATPGVEPTETLRENHIVRVGEPLFRLPNTGD